MKESLSQQTANLKHKNNRHKRWKGIVSILACMVVFCTVYALILPALTAEGTPHCGKEEHTHTEDCYEKKLICGKEEGEGAHQHSDDCYREEQVLVCQEPESDGHQHTDDCYTEEEVLTCTNTDEDHEHSEIDGCYTTKRVLTCGKEEGEDAHYHTEECYETQKILECGQEETAGHQHTAECYEDVLACGKEEHTHTLECYSDSTADVEDESQWSRGFANVAITGNWAKDLTAIAQTQVGYAESDRNYTVNEDNTINGYTRYGQWAGMPYADWSADFTSFCLYYANVPESAVSHNTGCEGWNSSAVSTNGYTPKEGDIILLDGNQDGITDHAGVVTSGSADSVTAIIGDSDKQVRTNTYSTGNAIITGYVPMPENPDFSDGSEEAEPTATPTPEATEAPEATPTETPEVTEEPTVTPTETPEVTEEPTVTPTEVPEITEEPTVTPTEIPEITESPEVTETPKEDTTSVLEEKTLSAVLYTDSTYTTELQDQTSVIVSGNLPKNAVVKAYPVNNINIEGKKILCAWDITIFDAEGKQWEPENGNSISVQFQLSELPEENADCSIYYVPDEKGNKKPEELQSEVTEDGISFNAEHFSIYVAALNADGESGNTVQSRKKFDDLISGISGSGTTYDKKKDYYETNLHLDLSFPKDLFTDENYGYYFDIPDKVVIPDRLIGQEFTIEGKTGGKAAGTYRFVKNNDGKYQILVDFNPDYINDAGDTMEGFLSFWGEVSGEAVRENGNIEVKFTESKTLVIKSDQIKYDDKETKNYDVKVSKAGSFNINDDTLTYTVRISSVKGTPNPLKLTDILEANGLTVKNPTDVDVKKFTVDKSPWEWETNLQPEDTSSLKGRYTYSYSESDNKIEMILPKLDPGTEFDSNGNKFVKCNGYEITYKYKLDQVPAGIDKVVNNKASVTGEDKTTGEIVKDSSSQSVSVNKKYTLDKTGSYDSENKKIDWEITVNDKMLDIAGSELTDTMFDSVNASDLTIIPQDGVEIVTSEETGKVEKIVFKATDGTTVNKNKYTIKYSTDVKTDETNWQDTKYKNTANFQPASGKGDSIGKDGWVDVPGPKGDVKKTAGTPEVSQDRKTVTVPWNVDITVPANTGESGYCLAKGIKIKDDFGKQYMTWQQIKDWKEGTNPNTYLPSGLSCTIEFAADDGNTYSIEDIIKGSDSSNTNLMDKKYKSMLIEVTKDFTSVSKISICYQTTADVENANNGEQFTNKINVGGKESSASWTYTKTSVTKTDGNGRTEETNVTNKDGALIWKVNTSIGICDNYKKLSIEDTLPEGIDLYELQLYDQNCSWKIDTTTGTRITLEEKTFGDYKVSGSYDLTSRKVILNIERTDGETIPAGANFTAVYMCKVNKQKLTGEGQDESEITGSTFTNTARVTGDNVEIGTGSQTQKWTEEVDKPVDKTLSKTGSFDHNAQRLNYSIEINPEAKDLSGGQPMLDLTDVLKYNINYDGTFAVTGREYTLIYDSVHLYEVQKDENGNVVKRELTSPDEWEWNQSTKVNGNKVEKTISAKIPNQKSLILEYSYSVNMINTSNPYNSSENAKLDAENTVTIEGKYITSNSDLKETKWERADSQASLKTGYVFTKVEKNHYGICLPGAEFSLFKYDSDQKTFVKIEYTYTTDEKGQFTIKKSDDKYTYEENTAYYVVETKAPEGYVLPDAPQEYYFWFPNSRNFVNCIPDNFTSRNPTDLSEDASHNEYVENIQNFYEFSKVEKDNQNQTISGTEFTVFEWNSETEEYEKTNLVYTTDANGKFSIQMDSTLKYNTAYYVTETKAADNYKLPDNPQKYYFWFKQDSAQSVNAPENFESENKPLNLLRESGKVTVENQKDYKYTFKKVEEEREDRLLPGAEFTVYKWNPTSSKYEETELVYRTDDNGTFSIEKTDSFQYNTAYYIKETKAPNGYQLPDIPQEYYFYFTSSDKAKYPECIPNDWNLFNGKSPKDLASGSYEETVTNERLDGASIAVKKNWVDQNGNPANANVSSVSFRLWQKATEDLSVNQVNITVDIRRWCGDEVLGKPQILNCDINDVIVIQLQTQNSNMLLTNSKGEVITFTSRTDSNGLYTYSYRYVVQETETLTGYTNQYNDDQPFVCSIDKSSSSNIPTVTIPDKEIGIYTIYFSSGWTWNSDDVIGLYLPLAGTYEGKPVNYTYYIEEIQENANAYQLLKYENNNGITDSSKEGNIVISNKINDTAYTLPETGGTGTNRFTAVGLSLMAASLMCEYVMRRKRRERRGK